MRIKLKHLCILLFIVLFVREVYFLVNSGVQLYPDRDVLCPKFLQEGKLYAGQLACGQGPVTYYLALVAQKISGDLLKGTFGLMILFNFVMGLFFVFYSSTYVLNTLFFSLVLLPVLFGDFSATLAAFFFFLSYYLVFEKYCRKNLVIGGVLLALSLLSKTIVLFAVPAFFIALIIKESLPEQSLLKKLVLYTKFFLMSFLITIVIFSILHSNWLSYSLLVHNNPTNAVPIIDRLSIFMMNLFNIYVLQAMFFFFFSLYALFFKQTRHFFVLFFPFFINFFLLTGYAGDIHFNHVLDYHQAPFLIIFFFTFTHLLQTFKIKNILQRRTLLFLVVITLFYFTVTTPQDYFNPIMGTPIFSRQSGLQTITSQFLNQINFTDSAFVDEVIYDRLSADKKTQANIIVNHYNEYRSDKLIGVPDTNIGAGIKDSGVYSQEANKELETKDIQYNEFIAKNISSEIRRNTFQLIAIAPWGNSLLFQMIQPMVKKFNWCSVLVPDFYHTKEYSKHYSTFFYSDKQNCDKLRMTLFDYFSANFDKICSVDEFVAKKTKEVLERNNILLDKSCSSTATKYVEETTRITVIDYVFMLVSFSIILSLIIAQIKNKRIQKNS